MDKEDEIMEFLHQNVFDPILNSRDASDSLKKGVRYTIMRMQERDALGMISYYWSAIVGTKRSTEFASMICAMRVLRDSKKLLMSLEIDSTTIG